MSPTSEIPEKEHQEKISTNPSSGKRKVTLYFPCYNAEKYIGDCLEGALKQTYPIEEILVIDDGSTDGSMEIVSQYPVKIIQHEVNKGLAAARNTAIQNATGDFIASLDSDCVPEPDWLERLMENFTLSPTVLGGMGVEQIAGVGGKLLEAHTTTVADLWRSVHLKQHWGDGKIVDLADPLFVFGSNNVYRKDALLKVGLYNEEYRTNFEDCDMFARLKAANYTMIYEPKAIARHLRRDDVCSVIKTLWNWTKPTHKRDGHFDSFKGLTQKINTNLGLATKYLVEDISRRKIQILYPDLLMMPYHTLLDLKFRHQLQTLSDEPNRHELEMLEQTFNALILLAAWTIKQKSPDTDLAKLVAENLLTIQLDNPQTPPLSLEELEKLSLQTSDTLDINRYPSVNESYLDYFFTGFRHVLNKIADDSLVFKMVEVSGKAVHQKAEGGKRKENTTHPTVDTVELSPITNHQSPVKVLLANPPWRKGNRYGVRAGSRWPFTMEIGNAPIPGYVPFPFFLAYATANLKKHGIEAIIVDAIAEGLTDEEFIYRVRGYKPDLILIETATASIDVDLNMAERLKAECDNDVYIALSGTHATVMKESLLKEHEYIDFILYGEYEFTLLELAQCLQNGKIPPAPFNKGGENLEEVQGLAFRRDSEISVTPPRLLIENL
ncbi:MAG: glycosyltransferase, partial [Candidatus Poribacteria bacterium]